MIQRPLSFLAFIGVVGLTGVVINSAIILVDYIRELQTENKFGNMKELLVFASRKRLRAVLATGLTTVVGLLPSALGLGGYDAILVDITLALSWGMIIGTLLSLIWIPVGFLIINDFKNYWFKKSAT
jgi:multidrug efflux pump subunit AcrB